MTYTPVLPPYPHQVEALEKMQGQRAFCLRMEMRTGKTKVICDDWGRMEDAGEVRDLLYTSPAGALYGEDALETQIPLHMPPGLAERTRVLVWRTNGGAEYRREVERFLKLDPRRPRVLLMNIEALSTVERARELCRAFLEPRDRGSVMAVGESTCIKGQSQRTAAAQELGEWATYRRIETGLIAPHSPLDLFNQFYFLNPKILRQQSWFGFRARYAFMKDVCFLPKAKQEEFRAKKRRLPTSKIVVAYRNEEELRDLIEPYTYHKRFRDCAKAPPGTYRFRDVLLTPEQARMYREFKDYATAKIEGAEAHMTATVALTQILRLHQLVCGYSVDDEGGGIHDVPERRTAALEELLEEHGGQAVVWATYNHNIQKIVARLKRVCGDDQVAAFWGGNRPTRIEEERRFKSGAARIMVANPAAGGKGREWSCANLMVYYSNSPDLEHRDQSEMRVEAINKLDPVTRVDLRVRGTPDERIIKNLRGKIDMASTLQGDGYREWLV